MLHYIHGPFRLGRLLPVHICYRHIFARQHNALRDIFPERILHNNLVLLYRFWI